MNTWKIVEIELRQRLAYNARRLREAEGFSQPEVAELCGLSTRSYQRFEEGATSPSLATIAQVIFALNVDPSELLVRP